MTSGFFIPAWKKLLFFYNKSKFHAKEINVHGNTANKSFTVMNNADYYIIVAGKISSIQSAEGEFF